MMKSKSVLLAVLTAVLFSGLVAAADFSWDNETGDNLWSTMYNWDPNQVPAAGDRAVIDLPVNDPNRAVVDSLVPAIDSLWVGEGNGGFLEVAATGELTTAEMFSPVTGSPYAKTVVDGGMLTNTGPTYLGYVGDADLNVVNSGQFSTTTFYGGYGAGYTGTLNVQSGATATCSALSYLGFQGLSGSPAAGQVFIDGGTLNCPAGLWMNYLADSESLFEIYDGAFNVTNAGSSFVVGYTTGAARANFLGGVSTIDIIYIGFNTTATGDPNIYIGSGATVNLTSATSGLNVGWYARANAIVDGGNLTANYGYVAATANADGSELIVRDGDVSITNLYAGSGGKGYVEVTGGTLETTTGWLGFSGAAHGYLDVSGGTVNVWNLLVSYVAPAEVNLTGGEINVGAGGLAIGYWGYSGTVNVTGGTLNADAVLFGASGTGHMDISGTGKLVLTGNQIANVDSWVNAGYLTANGTQRAVKAEIVNGDTEVTYDAQLAKKAWNPYPGNTYTVPGDEYDSTVLTWNPGVGALSHDIYFGTDPAAVANATTADPEFQVNKLVGDETFDPGTLALNETYYWRIDEIDGTVATGQLWSFTVSNFIGLDDFETYADTAALQAVWSGADSLSTSLALDSQSMCVAYDNTSSPYMSEAVRSYAGSPVDFTQAGVEAIHVWFHGLENNAADKVYIRITDSSDVSATVLSDSADDIVQPVWQSFWYQLAVDLDDFTTVDLTSVKEIALGVGTGAAGGTGSVYFDNLRLYIPVYVPYKAVPMGEVFGSNAIDFTDFAVLASLWDSAPAVVSATAASTTGLRAYYEFENDPNDSSGNDFHAATPFGAAYTAGYNGQGFDMTVQGTPPYTNYVAINNSTLFSTVSDQMTVAFWANGDAGALPNTSNFIQTSSSILSFVKYFNINLPTATGLLLFDTAQAGGGATVEDNGVVLPYDRVAYQAQATSAFAGQWNHYAFVKNAVTGFQGIYLNGVMVAGGYAYGGTMAGINEMWINDGLWSGVIDEYRIYDRALSQGEIIDLAGLASVNQPVAGNGIWAVPDLDGDGDVDQDDLNIMASNWTIVPIFP